MDKLTELQKELANSNLNYQESVINYDNDKRFLTIYIDDEKYIDVDDDLNIKFYLDFGQKPDKKLKAGSLKQAFQEVENIISNN